MPKVQRSHGRDRPGPSACPSTHRGRLGASASPTLPAGPRPRHTQRPWEVGQQGLCPADQEGGGEPRPRQSVEFCPPAQSPASPLHPSRCHTAPQTPGGQPQFRDTHTAAPATMIGGWLCTSRLSCRHPGSWLPREPLAGRHHEHVHVNASAVPGRRPPPCCLNAPPRWQR